MRITQFFKKVAIGRAQRQIDVFAIAHAKAFDNGLKSVEAKEKVVFGGPPIHAKDLGVGQYAFI